MRYVATAVAALALALPEPPARAEEPRVVIDKTALALGTVARGTPAEGAVLLRNQGSQVLRAELARASNGIVVRDLPLELRPGGTAPIRIAVQTDDLNGLFRGELRLTLNDPALPEVVVTVVFRVVDPIEVIPRGGFAVSVVQGQVQEAAVEIVNHERAPLRLGAIEHAQDRFNTGLEVLEPGRRYRLRLVLAGNSPAGSRNDTISIRTSSSAIPVLEVHASTTIRERVRVWPESLDLGTIRLSQIANARRVARQTLIVMRRGTDDFQAMFNTDLPALDIQARPAPLADRWHVSVALKSELLYPGPISGHIFVSTSDPEYPVLSVPVFGEIVAD